MRAFTLLALLTMSTAICGAADAPPLKADHKEAVERQLIKLEHDWNEAMKNRDQAALSALCAQDFTFTGDDGKLMDRRLYLGEIMTRLKVTTYKESDVTARSYGDTGVTNGQWTGTILVDGHASELTVRFTDTFVLRDSKWWAVASHMSRVQEEGAAL